MSSYIPPRDADLANWANNFQTLITTNPGLYGLLAADAAVIAGVTQDFLDAYDTSIAGETRGPFSIAAKDAAKIDMLATVRPYGQQIANNAAVSTDDKIALGLNPRTNPPTPVAAPTTQPVLILITAASQQHFMRFRDAAALPTSRAKPAGVIQMQLFGSASDTVITDPTLLPLLSTPTKVPFSVAWQSGDVGKIAYYAARWATRTGLVGPWSPIFSFGIV